MRSDTGHDTEHGTGRGRRRHRRRSRSAGGLAVAVRVFVWGHLMGVAVYLVHGAFWLAMVAVERIAGKDPSHLWITLRLSDGAVLGWWVLGILTLCLLLGGYREQLGLDK